MAVAGRWRLHVARGRRRAHAGRAGVPRHRRPHQADRSDATRDAGWCGRAPDVWRRGRAGRPRSGSTGRGSIQRWRGSRATPGRPSAEARPFGRWPLADRDRPSWTSATNASWRASSSAPTGPIPSCARGSAVARPPRLPPRVGLTWHVVDPRPEPARPIDARLVVVRDGYVGLAPVPGARLNIGIVLGRSWHASLARDGAAATVRRVLDLVPLADDDPVAWADATPCDRIAGASPLGVRVTRRAGSGWFLVGDAAGFLDPFTGEGLHRALVSTELAARAIPAALSRRPAAPATRGSRVRPLDASAIRLEGRGLVPRPVVPCPPGAVRVRRATARRTARRPCDDGPRDGRPRARVACARSPLPRRATCAVTTGVGR